MSENKLTHEEMLERISNYFKNISKEQFMKDLEEARCLHMIEEVEDEEENQTNYSATKYRTPDGVPADNIIFTITFDQDIFGTLPKMDLKVLMIQRKKWPYAGSWAIPGGFSNENETILQAAERELEEETGIKGLAIKHLDVYSKPNRDPRGWIISSAYYALVNEKYLEHRKAADDAADERLFSINEILQMHQGDQNGEFDSNIGSIAFDHLEIIQDAFEKVKIDMLQSDIAKEFLPEEFTIAELFEVVATVVPQIKEIYPKNQMGNFKRKVLARGLIEELEKESNRNSRRPAKLYKFVKETPTLSHYI